MSSQQDSGGSESPRRSSDGPGPRSATGGVPAPGHIGAAGAALDHLDDDVTVILLSLAARKRVGPFAPLLRRIERPDGPGWFLDAVVVGCRAAGVAIAALSDPVGGPTALRRLKAWSKSTLAAAQSAGQLAPQASPHSAPHSGPPAPDHSSAISGAAGSHERPADEATLQALVAYAVAVGTGLAVHDLRLSTRPPKEWDPLFVDLAELVPMPWAETFRRAAGR